MEKAPRHMGIELLRIVATGMIVLHHLLAHGGLLAVFPSPGPTDAAMRLLNAFAYCAVNLYGLISGYGGSGRFRPARLVGLWVQAWFTGVVLTALLSPLTPVTAADWRTALLPIGSQEYWYLTAYFGLYVLSPALHAAVERLSRRQLTLTLLGCAVLFTLTPSAAESLSLSGGYHVGWLCVLYLLGAWLRRYGSPARSNWKPLLCFFLCVGIAGGWQIAALLLKARGIREVLLMPMMLVAGDHANNDMAGTADDSHKTLLEKAGFSVSVYIHGLGENGRVSDPRSARFPPGVHRPAADRIQQSAHPADPPGAV